MRLLKIGEIAKETGVTVRTLHHYDDIGLLSPSHRSESGYRLYTLKDLMQLQKIKSLQQLGFSLEDIGNLIAQPKTSLVDIIQKHLDSLNVQIKQQQALIQRLTQLAEVLQQNQAPSVELLLQTLRVTIMYEKYYSKEQLDHLAKTHNKMSPEEATKVQVEWQNIFAEFRQLQSQHQSAASSRTQELARRCHELIDIFTGGDEGIKRSMQKMYDKEGGENVLSGMGMAVDKALFDFVQEAMKLAKSG